MQELKAIDVGKAVRKARKQQGFTRDGLALATGLSPKFITHVENGKQTTQLGKVLFLLRELGIEVTLSIPNTGPYGPTD